MRIEYVSDGRSPSEVEESLNKAGFVQVKGTSTFETEVADAQGGKAKREEMHPALRGMGVIYEPSLGRPMEELPGQSMGYQESLPGGMRRGSTQTSSRSSCSTTSNDSRRADQR